MSIKFLFFPLLFSNYCCSVDSYIVCVSTLSTMLASSFPSFPDTYFCLCHLWDVRLYALTIISSNLLVVSSSNHHKLVALHWRLSDWLFPQVSRNPQSILADLNTLDGLDSSSHFLIVQSSFKAFRDRSKCDNHNWHDHHHHVPQVSQLSVKFQILSLFFLSLIFTLWSTERQNLVNCKFLFY